MLLEIGRSKYACGLPEFFKPKHLCEEEKQEKP